jgi:MoaA/NifB/PqqE/SkfB family radical SAM enzyme
MSLKKGGLKVMTYFVPKLKFALKHPDLIPWTIRNKIEYIKKKRECRREDGWSSFPTAITIRITEKCNLKCEMCPYHREESGIFSKNRRPTELEFNVAKSLIDEVSSYRPSVTITGGGEPFLYNELFSLIGHIKNYRMLCILFTNGTLLQRRIADVVDSNLDVLAISIDGPTGKIHDEIRKVPGTFDKAVAGIRLLAENKKKLGKKKPIVVISFTITRRNYSQLTDMVYFAESLGVDILNINHLRLLSRDLEEKFWSLMSMTDVDIRYDDCDYRIASSEGIDPEELANQVATVERIKNGLSGMLIQWSPPVAPERIPELYQLKYHVRKFCYAPWHRAMVMTNGDVIPCLLWNVGNIYQQSFIDLWNNSRFRHFRNTLRRSGGVFPPCMSCCSLLYKKRN